jgi:G:T/U-mismatch repair DNA glycosylase
MSHVVQEKAIGVMMGTLPSLPFFKHKTSYYANFQEKNYLKNLMERK